MSTLLEEQIGVIGLLQAMFPFESELVLSADTARFLDSDLADPPQSLDMTLSIRLDEEQSRVLEMNICLLTAVASGSDFQKIRISPRQPNWLTRTEFVNLAAAITPLRGDEEPSDYILCMVNSIKEACQAILSRTQEQTQVEVAEEDAGDEALQRVWFWFPSLSTKEKRRDLVDYAPRYGLTGFVLAGKPGLLCLEGDARKVDQYMSAIKSESWSDIPSYQKKVTERLRKPLIDKTERKFSSMTEITDQIPKYGQYNHRGDMSEVKRLMETWGVGEDFNAVVMQSG